MLNSESKDADLLHGVGSSKKFLSVLEEARISQTENTSPHGEESHYLQKLQTSELSNQQKRESASYFEPDDNQSITVATAGHQNIQIIEQETSHDEAERQTQTTKGEQRLEFAVRDGEQEQVEPATYRDFLPGRQD